MDEDRIGRKDTAYKILIGKPDGKRPLGRPRRRWEDNIYINYIFFLIYSNYRVVFIFYYFGPFIFSDQGFVPI